MATLTLMWLRMDACLDWIGVLRRAHEIDFKLDGRSDGVSAKWNSIMISDYASFVFQCSR